VSSARRIAAGLAGLALAASAGLALIAAAEVPDPTRPPAIGDAASEALSPDAELVPTGPGQLTAIVISPTRRIAVIDGVAVRVGDEVGAARVIAIEPLSVTLRGPDGDVVLTIAGPPVKGKKP
jgi:hypothetical protein